MNEEVALKVRVLEAAVSVALVAGVVSACQADQMTAPSRSAEPMALEIRGDCPIKYRTLATATDAYWASTGEPPTSQSDLVIAGLLRVEVEDFELASVEAEYHLVAVGSCAGFVPD